MGEEHQGHTGWEEYRSNRPSATKIVSTGAPPRVEIRKTSMRGAWRWKYSVDWKTDDDLWVGLGGWTHTKSAARRAARELVEENPFCEKAERG